MQPPESKHWHRAGEIEGQGVRQVELGERLILVIESDNDEVLAIDACCETCGQILTIQSSTPPTTFCSRCKISQSIPEQNSERRLPTMLVDSEIYVLLVPAG